VRVAVAFTTGPGVTVEVKVPCHVPETEGTRFALIVPLSPPAQPVPVTVYVPERFEADPLAFTVTVWLRMAGEDSVILCPLTDPETGTSVVGSKQPELKMWTTPEMELPVWVRLPPARNVFPGAAVELALIFQLPDWIVNAGPGGVDEPPPPQPENRRATNTRTHE